MKSHSTFYLRPAVIGLSWSFLLPVDQAQAAVSVTLENQGWFVASFELEGCGKKINVGDIPLGQQITVDLGDFGCFNDPVALRVFYYYWGWQTFTGHQPTTFTRFIGNWWKLDWGASYSNRDSPLRLIMRGVGWAPEMFVIDD